MDAERRLLVLYVSGFVCSLISSASMTIVWLYWDSTLNYCTNVNCGCILYSVITFNSFLGGAVWLCRFAVFTQLPVLMWATTAALFHTYRVCVPKRAPVRKRTVTFNEDGSRRSMVNTREPPKYSVLAVFSIVAAVLLFAQAWIVTTGYYVTCREYRKQVSTQVNANGNLAQMVSERMSCGTVFDFLDYLQPDPPELRDQYRRTYIIHTAYYLQVAIASSWLNCTVWTITAAYNIYLVFYTSSKT